MASITLDLPSWQLAHPLILPCLPPAAYVGCCCCCCCGRRHLLETTARKLVAANPKVSLRFGVAVTGLLFDDQVAPAANGTSSASSSPAAATVIGQCVAVACNTITHGSTFIMALLLAALGSQTCRWLLLLAFITCQMSLCGPSCPCRWLTCKPSILQYHVLPCHKPAAAASTCCCCCRCDPA